MAHMKNKKPSQIRVSIRLNEPFYSFIKKRIKVRQEAHYPATVANVIREALYLAMEKKDLT